MISKKYFLLTCSFFALSSVPALGHYQDPNIPSHNAIKVVSEEKTLEKQKSKERAGFDPWKLLEMALSPAYAYVTKVSIIKKPDFIYIKSNGLPTHATGQFPNSGNPNRISAQSYSFRVTAKPKFASKVTKLRMYPFGVAINGVPFDPNAAEWWQRNPRSGWTYEAMVMGPRLGIDQNNAHVQPTGAYHYHGIPTGLLKRFKETNRPLLIGYAADGFPIYGPYGYKDPKNSHSKMVKLKASYRVKSGTRPSGPGGKFSGVFVEDYEYVKGLGDLDDTNGRFGFTPEYPDGTYYYVVSASFPFIPRGFKGTPDTSFFRYDPGPPGGRRGGRRGQGQGQGQGFRPGFGHPPRGGRPPFGGPPPHMRPGGPPPHRRPGGGQFQQGYPPRGQYPQR